MNINERISQYRLSKQIAKEYSIYSRYNQQYDYDDDFLEIMQKYDVNYIYAYMHHYFHHRSPKFLREHREYFKKDHRGFGEDAFHAMWWLLFLARKPSLMLEIGIYRGQTITLWGVISKYLHCPAKIHGISPFTPLGDTVSTYLNTIDYYADVLESFGHFQLSPPCLLKALSTDTEAVHYIHERKWDLIYIDGSHDFEVVKMDYQHSLDSLAEDGILVIDDAGLNTPYQPPGFAFAGHPGTSKVVRELADKEMKFIGSVGHNSIFLKK